MIPPTGLDDAIEKFRPLHPFRRLEALRIACDDALAIWRRYCAAEKPIEYMDSIVGMHHTVDETLPIRALADVDRYLSGQPITSTVMHDYVEPTVAMQDTDLDFPPDIENIYYAIYNLHGLCAGSVTIDEGIILQQVANSMAVSPDDWARDWWTRCWDAWATRPDPAYPPVATELVEAIQLALGGDLDHALEAVAQITGADLRDAQIKAWLAEHLYALAPEAIAVSPERQVATIDRDRLAIGSAQHTMDHQICRLARFTSARELHVAGDIVDDIGVVGTFWSLWLDGQRFRLEERRGRRSIAAIGGFGTLIARDRIAIYGQPDNLLGDGPIVAAALSPDFAATHDGDKVTLWNLENSGWQLLDGPAAPQRLAIADRKLFVSWANHTASLHALD